MFKAVSLFTGAGGLDLGLESAGFDTIAAIEMDQDAVRSLKYNRDWLIFDKNIHDVSSQKLMSEANIKEGEIDLLHGGPPCQPFSKSGYWANGDSKRLDDPRATTLEAYLRVLRDLKPRVFLIENVAGLAYDKKDEGLKLLKNTIENINKTCSTNYSFQIALLNAADYGVPQERERVFIIGSRDGKDFKFPEKTHQRLIRSGGHIIENINNLTNNETDLPLALNAWDAIGEFEDDMDPELLLSGKWADLLPSIPEGCNYLYHTDRGDGLPIFGWRRRYWNFLLKLSKHYPSWTIQAQPGSAVGPFHWKNRWLSTRELKRIQTFPDTYHITGTHRQAHKQLGNAVPSALAEVLGIEIRNQLLDDRSSLKPILIPQKKSIIPKMEKVYPVPEKYKNLINQDSAHPGTGKGRGALALIK